MNVLRIAFFTCSLIMFTLQVSAQEVVSGEIIFKLNEEMSQQEVDRLLSSSLPNTNIEKVRQLFPRSRASFNSQIQQRKKSSSYELDRIYCLKLSSSNSVQLVLDRLNSLSVIQYAQPHYLPQLAAKPNDSLYYRLRNQFELIQVNEAWEITEGDTNMVIGIVDSGTDPDHEDLSANIARNYDDPINGIDDDGDGYVDNFIGWDLAENDNDPQSLKSHHGVHMSGIVSAVPNNEIGVAGIAYRCRFLPVKVADDSTGALIAAYEGVKYAADAGCQIINCSWVANSAGPFEREIIDYAVNEKGALVIASAGNQNADNLQFPAAFENVVGVSATDTNDIKSFNSNYNVDVSISAPGVSWISTWNDNLYQFTSGTSVSSAVVSGAAALVKTAFPEWSNQQVIEQLKKTSVFLDGKNPEFEGLLGAGRINLFRALTDTTDADEFENELVVYPNPVDESRIVNVWMLKNANDEVEVALFNEIGKEFKVRINDVFSNADTKFKIDLNGVSSGLYVLKITSKNETYTSKIVLE